MTYSTVAKTLSAWAEHEMIQPEHIAEATLYRSLDRQLWV